MEAIEVHLNMKDVLISQSGSNLNRNYVGFFQPNNSGKKDNMSCIEDQRISLKVSDKRRTHMRRRTLEQ